MFDAPREMESLIEERFGRFVARIALLAVLAGTVGGSFLIVVAVAVWGGCPSSC